MAVDILGKSRRKLHVLQMLKGSLAFKSLPPGQTPVFAIAGLRRVHDLIEDEIFPCSRSDEDSLFDVVGIDRGCRSRGGGGLGLRALRGVLRRLGGMGLGLGAFGAFSDPLRVPWRPARS
jgi:hypothetical protein